MPVWPRIMRLAPKEFLPRICTGLGFVGRSDFHTRGVARGQSSWASLLAMTNVTKKNFTEAYKQLKGHMKAADFVAIDLEMTGVESTLWRRNQEMDSCETRYQNLKHSAEKFAVWQCGVCPFKWDPAGKKYIAYPYNFFIFPRSELQMDIPARGFFCQTSSLEFLAKHNFDFNTCIYEGISYLTKDQETAARVHYGLDPDESVKKKQSRIEEPEIPLSRSGDVMFVEKIRAQVGQWRDRLLSTQQKWQSTGSRGGKLVQSSPLQSDDSNAGLAIAKEEVVIGAGLGGLRPSLVVDLNLHVQSRLVKQVLRQHFPDLVGVLIDKQGTVERSQMRIIFTNSKEDRAKLLEELEQEERNALEMRISEAVGFRKVIDAIAESGLPLVGHNCILDMAHFHDKFIGPLPPSVAQFSTSLQTQFPCIMDTKYLLRSEPTLRGVLANRSTSLAIVFAHICQGFADRAVASGRFHFGKGKILNTSFSKVAVEVPEDFQRYGGPKETGLKHEAGFDAYMTGAVFAQACHILQIDATTIRSLPQAVKGCEAGLATYANLLALGWVGNMALDLSSGKKASGVKAFRGPHPAANNNSNSVVLVWGFPPGHKEHNVRTMVHKIFNREKRYPTVDISLVDDSAAFVNFKSPHILGQFLHIMRGPLSGFASEMVAKGLRAAPYEVYNELCKSPLSTERLADSAQILGLDKYLFGDSGGIVESGVAAPVTVEAPPVFDFQDPAVEGATKANEEVEQHFPVPPDWGDTTRDPLTESGEAEVSVEKEVAELAVDSLGEVVGGKSSWMSGSTGQETLQVATVGSRDSSRDDKDFSALQCSHSNWMKRSISEDQPSPVATPSVKKSRTGDPRGGSDSKD